MLHEFDGETAAAIRKSLPEDLLAHADAGSYRPTEGSGGRHWAADADPGVPGSTATAVLSRQEDRG
jgi:phospholipid/cholesterol/gamma-HCH transport system ATP-binding protein